MENRQKNPGTSSPGKTGRTSVVLLSGGLDSATCLGIAMERGDMVHCLSFDYGQRHTREIESSQALVEHYRRRFPGMLLGHRVIKIDLKQIGGSALTDEKIKVPDFRDREVNDIPPTYVPARNLILLSYATAFAEVNGATGIFIGVNSLDYSGYPDCRPEFVKSFEETARLATRAGVTGNGIAIEAPLQEMTKAQIIKAGTEIGVPYGLTWSCYRGGEKPCGTCDSCVLRARGFAEAGFKDDSL